MEKALKDKIRQKLLKKEEQLARELEEVASKGTVTFPNYGDDEGENSAEVATFDTNVSLEQTLEKALRDVRGALKRINEDTYGVCKYCGQLINERRLLARPSSSSCVSCKEEIKSRV